MRTEDGLGATDTYVLVKDVDVAASSVTVDVVEYLTGVAARRACAEDGVPGHGGGLCDTFYIRDRETRPRIVPVRSDAIVTILADGPDRPRSATLAEVGARMATHGLFRVATTGGAIARLAEVWAP